MILSLIKKRSKLSFPSIWNEIIENKISGKSNIKTKKTRNLGKFNNNLSITRIHVKVDIYLLFNHMLIISFEL